MLDAAQRLATLGYLISVKIVWPSACCGRAWTNERVRGREAAVSAGERNEETSRQSDMAEKLN